MGDTRATAERVVLGLLLAALPLSTAAMEVACALALALALTGPSRTAFLAAPWARPALAVAAVWVLASPISGQWREGLGHAWVLAPLVALPALARSPRAEVVGLWAAAGAGGWALVQALTGAPERAGFSHHLTLAYALLPPLGVALTRRAWAPAALVFVGILASGSRGALPALLTTLVAVPWGRRPVPAAAAWLGGALLTVGLLATAAPADDLRQRAILWTGGLTVAATGPVGPGAYPQASAGAYEALSPGFWFPNHAHDSAVQVLAVLGPAGLVATVWLCVAALGVGGGAAAGLAGVLVGALTQDVLGDLEVARAAWVWLALASVSPAHPDKTAPR